MPKAIIHSIEDTSEDSSLRQLARDVDHWDDDEVVSEIRNDPEAFAILYKRYAEGVYRYLFGKVGNQADAEDLTSQTFIAALEGLRSYRQKGKFAAWLFSIARRKAADYHRKVSVRGELTLDIFNSPSSQPDELLGRVVQTELHQKLAELYRQLPEDQQELVRLRYFAGLTYVQIGQVLNKSEAAIGMALSRLISRLRTQLGPQEEAHEE